MARLGGADGIAVSSGGQLIEQIPPIVGAGGYGTTPWPGGGVMGVNTRTRLNDIKDGTSNTILIDELRIGPSANDMRGTWAMGLCGASISAGNSRDDTPTPNFSCSGCDDIHGSDDRPDIGMGACTGCESWQVTAKSLHPGGVNTAMADGSVRFIKDSVTKQAWFMLHSRNDRQVLPSDAL